MSAAALSTYREWAEESTTGNSKKTHRTAVSECFSCVDLLEVGWLNSDHTNCADLFSHIATVLCNVNIYDFRIKYSAATGPPVGLECEHCGQRHQVQLSGSGSRTCKMFLLIDLSLHFVNIRNLIVLSKKVFVIFFILFKVACVSLWLSVYKLVIYNRSAEVFLVCGSWVVLSGPSPSMTWDSSRGF